MTDATNAPGPRGATGAEVQRAPAERASGSAHGETVGAHHRPLHQRPQSEGGNLSAAWQPGQSGNPSGRPKGSVSLVAVLERKLREEPERADRIIDAFLRMAEGGDQVALNAVRHLLDRVDGPVERKREHEPSDALPPLRVVIDSSADHRGR